MMFSKNMLEIRFERYGEIKLVFESLYIVKETNHKGCSCDRCYTLHSSFRTEKYLVIKECYSAC